jgi:outer membrane protein OmpA-like peptidoglycan-associated protein
VAATAPPAPEIRVVLDPQKVFFGKMSSQMLPAVRRTLAEIGEFLSDHSSLWGEAVVAGHADRRGRFEYNLKLSRERARAVSDALQMGGTQGSKLRVEAYSFLRPADPGTGPVAWAKNRRVEIVIRDVKDETLLRKKIESLAKYRAESEGKQ